MCFPFFLMSYFFYQVMTFFHYRVFWFLFFDANILELYYSLVHFQILWLEVQQISFYRPVLLPSWHDCDMINTTCQSAKRAGKFITDLYVCSSLTHNRNLPNAASSQMWGSHLSKWNIFFLPLFHFYVYYYENIQSHKGNQMLSLTLVDTKPPLPHKSNTSSYQLMCVGPHSKQRKKSTNQFSI